MRVLNFGSLNIDFVYQMPHFVQAGETLSSTARNIFAGGKGLNQSISLAKAGIAAFHAGKIGPDGAFLLDLLKQSGADTSFVSDQGSVTGHAIIQVDTNGQNCILLFGGANQQISETEIDAVLAQFDREDILLLQNEISNLPHLLERAKEKGMRVALNPSPISDALLQYDLSAVRWFLLNEVEGRAFTNETHPKKICEKLLASYPDATIVLTVGKDGAFCADQSGICHCDTFDVPVVDTTAAGDTFTGYFLAGVQAGLSPAESLRRGCAASSIAVSRAGASVSIPTKQEVDAFLENLKA